MHAESWSSAWVGSLANWPLTIEVIGPKSFVQNF